MNTSVTVTKNENGNKIRAKVFSKIKRAVACVSAFATAMMMEVSMAYATTTTPAPGSAEAKWNTVIGFIVPWIARLGGAIILIGAVEWGLAFKSNDAEGKTNGMRTIIAGCIVTAVGVSSDIFLA